MTDYPNDHHIWPDSVPLDYPIYAVLRNPVDQLVSWWNHVDVRKGSKRRPLKFAQEYENIMYFFKEEDTYRLNIYGWITDVFMIYDDKLTDIRNKLKLENLEIIGKSKTSIGEGERQELAQYMEEHFKADVLLWKRMSKQDL